MTNYPTTGYPLLDWVLFMLAGIGIMFLLRIGGCPEPVEEKWDEKEDKKS
jgi:hypothetical protein